MYWNFHRNCSGFLLRSSRKANFRGFASKYKKIEEKQETPFLSATQFAVVGGGIVVAIYGIKKWSIRDNAPAMFSDMQEAVEKCKIVEEKLGLPLEFTIDKNKKPEKTPRRGIFPIFVSVKGPIGSADIEYIAEEDIRMPSEKNHEKPWNMRSLVVKFNDKSSTCIINEKSEENMFVPTLESQGKGPSGWAYVGMGIIGVLIGSGLGLYFTKYFIKKGAHVYDTALEMVKQHPKVIKALGTPIKSKREDFNGKILSNSAQFQFKCHGPKGYGNVFAQAYRQEEDKEEWEFVYMKVSAPGLASQINILGKNQVKKDSTKES